MARRLVEEEERRALILSSAWKVLIERGYAAARVADIARLSGTSTGTVHYYFPTKEDVLDQALRYAADRAFDRHHRMLSELTDPAERLRRLVELQIPDRTVRDEWTIWLEFWNEANRREPLRASHAAIYHRWRALIVQLVQEGQDQRLFAAELDVDDITEEFIALVDGLGLHILLEPGEAARERMRRILFRMIDGLRA
ncbi:hypothetical protein GCM10022226_31000 [Sphaerisporangium flaviroseum]|uniref:HTH tetR-type domain-containing protein n=1 Tax=Sphaerisporangium flaviroseum TaxID=509199 RepID=A0ABP7I4B9_9ACTN